MNRAFDSKNENHFCYFSLFHQNKTDDFAIDI